MATYSLPVCREVNSYSYGMKPRLGHAEELIEEVA